MPWKHVLTKVSPTQCERQQSAVRKMRVELGVTVLEMSRRTNEQANRLTAGSGQLGKSVQVCGVIISDASSSRKSDLRSDPVSEGDNSRHKISIFFPIILLEVKEAEIIHLRSMPKVKAT